MVVVGFAFKEGVADRLKIKYSNSRGRGKGANILLVTLQSPSMRYINCTQKPLWGCGVHTVGVHLKITLDLIIICCEYFNIAKLDTKGVSLYM